MEPRPSSVISKAVVEEFIQWFLEQSGVILLSESRNQVVAWDDRLAQDIGLIIHLDRNLPGLILVDLGLTKPLLVLAGVVATAGPSQRSTADGTDGDRDGSRVQQGSVSGLAWRSFAWVYVQNQNTSWCCTGAPMPSR